MRNGCVRHRCERAEQTGISGGPKVLCGESARTQNCSWNLTDLYIHFLFATMRIILDCTKSESPKTIKKWIVHLSSIQYSQYSRIARGSPSSANTERCLVHAA